ncbi:MAG: hypothetical protein HQK54_13980 [Oligoflexales bacterium]|nr:hypothetical protein [Oligoflexales bacterium]
MNRKEQFESELKKLLDGAWDKTPEPRADEFDRIMNNIRKNGKLAASGFMDNLGGGIFSLVSAAAALCLCFIYLVPMLYNTGTPVSQKDYNVARNETFLNPGFYYEEIDESLDSFEVLKAE